MSLTHAARLTSLLAAAIVPTGCQSDTNPSPDAFAANPWTLSDRQARIGSVDDSDYIFNPIVRMALGPDGLLYTAHEGEGTIRRWTADGIPAGSLGRKGEGPGEFQYPYGVGFFGDSLWVWDFLAVRVSYFDLEGRFLGSVSARVDRGSVDEPPLRPVAPLRDGTFMGMELPGRQAIADDILTGTPFVKMDADGRRLARIWTQPWEPHDAVSQTFGDTYLSGFGKRGLLVLERRAWTGEADPTVRVSEIGFDGDTIFTATVPYTLFRSPTSASTPWSVPGPAKRKPVRRCTGHRTFPQYGTSWEPKTAPSGCSVSTRWKWRQASR